MMTRLIRLKTGGNIRSAGRFRLHVFVVWNEDETNNLKSVAGICIQP